MATLLPEDIWLHISYISLPWKQTGISPILQFLLVFCVLDKKIHTYRRCRLCSSPRIKKKGGEKTEAREWKPQERTYACLFLRVPYNHRSSVPTPTLRRLLIKDFTCFELRCLIILNAIIRNYFGSK